MSRRIVLAPRAEHDLMDVWEYVFGLAFSEERADRQLAELHRCFERLAAFPAAGRLKRPWGRDVRAIAQGRYLVVYRVVGDELQVLRVSGGDQDLLDVE